MDPTSGERLRLPSGIHLFVKEVGDRLVAECDRDRCAVLFHDSNILDQRQVVWCGQPETADLGFAPITKEQQLAPGSGREPQA